MCSWKHFIKTLTLLLCQCLEPPELAAFLSIFTKAWLPHLRTLTHCIMSCYNFLNITWIFLSSSWEADLRTARIWWKRLEFQKLCPFQDSCILVKDCHVGTSKSLIEAIKSTGSENGKAKEYLVGAFVSIFLHPFQEKKFDPETIWRHAKGQYQSVKGKPLLKEHIFCKFFQLCIFCLFVYTLQTGISRF